MAGGLVHYIATIALLLQSSFIIHRNMQCAFVTLYKVPQEFAVLDQLYLKAVKDAQVANHDEELRFGIIQSWFGLVCVHRLLEA